MSLFKKESEEMRRVNENIAGVDNDIRQKIFQLGQKIYQDYGNRPDELGPAYGELIGMLGKLEENRKGFIDNKLRLKGLYRCRNCDAIIPYGTVFCGKCGKKADGESDANEAAGGAAEKGLCRKCGAALALDDRFCMECGTPVALTDDNQREEGET